MIPVLVGSSVHLDLSCCSVLVLCSVLVPVKLEIGLIFPAVFSFCAWIVPATRNETRQWKYYVIRKCFYNKHLSRNACVCNACTVSTTRNKLKESLCFYNSYPLRNSFIVLLVFLLCLEINQNEGNVFTRSSWQNICFDSSQPDQGGFVTSVILWYWYHVRRCQSISRYVLVWIGLNRCSSNILVSSPQQYCNCIPKPRSHSSSTSFSYWNGELDRLIVHAFYLHFYIFMFRFWCIYILVFPSVLLVY